jgi:hypothetical protein
MQVFLFTEGWRDFTCGLSSPVTSSQRKSRLIPSVLKESRSGVDRRLEVAAVFETVTNRPVCRDYVFLRQCVRQPADMAASAPLSSSAHPRSALVGAALPDTRAGGQASRSQRARRTLDEQIRGLGLGDLIVANLYRPWPQPRTTPTL